MALLYKNAKKEVDREYAELKGRGFTPQSNKDGTYSWVDAKGGKYTGDLDPTGGRDAEASWAQQHFKRQARQDKIMSRKVSQELTAPGTPVATGNDGKVKGADEPKDNTTITRAEPVSKAATSQIKTPLPESAGYERTFSGRFPITKIGDGLVKGPTMPKPVEESKGKFDVTEFARTPYVSAAEQNSTDPFIYVDLEEYKAKNPGWKQTIDWLGGGVDKSEIRNEREGRATSTIFGGEMPMGNVPRKRNVDGQEQVLIKNPNWKRPIIGGTNILGNKTSVAENVAANVLTNAQDIMAPGMIVQKTMPAFSIAGAASRIASKSATGAAKSAESAKKWYNPIAKATSKIRAKSATKAGDRAEKLGEWAAREAELLTPSTAKAATATKAGETVISKAKELGPRKVPTGKAPSPSTGVPRPAGAGKSAAELPASKPLLALDAHKAPMIGDGAQKAKNVIDNLLKSKNILLKPPTKLAPGFKSGGKLIEKGV